MLRRIGLKPFAILLVVAAGCGRSDVSNAPAPTPAPHEATPAVASVDPNTVAVQCATPAEAVYDFLEALRTGNDDKATQLLSTVAREKTAAVNRRLTPQASNTATFSLGKVNMVSEDVAQVPCTWTDLDESGERSSDEAIWIARREAAGWRIAGMAVRLFKDDDRFLQLNFEDPEDMARRQQQAREEWRKRMESQMEVGTVETGKTPETPVRR